MADRQRILVLLVVSLLALAVLPGSVAADTRAGGSVVVGPNETVNEDLTVMGGSVVVEGTVNGDVTALGGTVVVHGTVNGDVTGVGGTVEIGQDAQVAGSVTASGGSVRIAGTVDGDVVAGAGTITLASTANIGGDLRYGGDLVQESGATVGGQIVQDDSISVGIGPIPSIPDWIGALYGLLTTLIVGALLLAVFPDFADSVATTATASASAAGKAALAGFGFLVVTPIVLVLIAFTIIGIPVTILGFLAYALLLVLGYVYGNYALGRYVLRIRDVENRWLALVVGVLLLAVVDFVPLLGGLVQFIVLLLGTGALAIGLYGRVRNRRGGDDAEASDATPSNESAN